MAWLSLTLPPRYNTDPLNANHGRWEDSLQLFTSSMCSSQRGEINSSSSSSSFFSFPMPRCSIHPPSLLSSPFPASERIAENENFSWGDPAYILFHPPLNPLINADVDALAGTCGNKERLFSADTNISLFGMRESEYDTAAWGRVYWCWYLI